MKVLLYFENQKLMAKSGIGRAYEHQCCALSKAGVDWTDDPYDDYDILHINTYGFNSGAIVKSARARKAKVVYHCHSTREDFRDSFFLSKAIAPFYERMLLHCYKMGDVLVAPTSYTKSLLAGYGLKQPIFAVSNGIDLDAYAYDPEKVKAFRNYFDIRSGEKIVIGVGLPFKRKGLLDFIEVARILPAYKFIWFGGLNRLLTDPQINRALRHPPRNVILPGYVKGAIIQGAYCQADCFFFPSYEENEGIVVLEALAAKCQVIVRDIGVFDPWLIDTENCYKGSDNRQFAELIDKCLEGGLPSTAEKGFLTAKERSLDNVGKQLRAVYEFALNNDGK